MQRLKPQVVIIKEEFYRVIQSTTYLDSADNTGAKRLFCIKVLGGSGRKYARLGDVVVVSVKGSDSKRKGR